MRTRTIVPGLSPTRPYIAPSDGQRLPDQVHTGLQADTAAGVRQPVDCLLDVLSGSHNKGAAAFLSGRRARPAVGGHRRWPAEPGRCGELDVMVSDAARRRCVQHLDRGGRGARPEHPVIAVVEGAARRVGREADTDAFLDIERPGGGSDQPISIDRIGGGALVPALHACMTAGEFARLAPNGRPDPVGRPRSSTSLVLVSSIATMRAISPGSPTSSRKSSVTVTQLPTTKRSTWSRPSRLTVRVVCPPATAMSPTAETIEPLSRDHLKRAVPSGPPVWISSR